MSACRLCHFFVCFAPIPKQTGELLPKSLVYCVSVSSLSLCSGGKNIIPTETQEVVTAGVFCS